MRRFVLVVFILHVFCTTPWLNLGTNAVVSGAAPILQSPTTTTKVQEEDVGALSLTLHAVDVDIADVLTMTLDTGAPSQFSLTTRSSQNTYNCSGSVCLDVVLSLNTALDHDTSPNTFGVPVV